MENDFAGRTGPGGLPRGWVGGDSSLGRYTQRVYNYMARRPDASRQATGYFQLSPQTDPRTSGVYQSLSTPRSGRVTHATLGAKARFFDSLQFADFRDSAKH